MRGTRPFSTFRDDEGGYTSVSVALALLLSLALVFSAVGAGWVLSRSADVQEVADAAALAGSNVVGAYSTIAQVCDACVLSMGLAGVLTLGTGLVTCAVPGLGAAGLRIVDAALDVLDARRDFASSVSEGLERLELAVPALVVANSYAVVEANEGGDVSYAGCAIPYPLESGSSFDMAGELDDAGMEEAAREMAEASDEAKEAQEAADAALREGWLADCGDEPRCMRERAAALAGLSGSENPDYASPEEWSFGAALERARAYYARRLEAEAPEGPGIEARVDSAARSRYYRHALDEVRAGWCRQEADGSVDLELPELPRNTEETRACELYTERVWPCSEGEGGRVLHAVADCPGASGLASGVDSLQAIDVGRVRRCRVCQFDVVDMGRVAAASTSIDNGFEHYWDRVVEASEDYERASRELARAQGAMRDAGEEGAEGFGEALDLLAAERPRLLPPGAYGCVAVVGRAGGTQVPSAALGPWVGGAELPAGAAVSGAVLAPDSDTDGGDVLSSFLDGVAGSDSLAAGVADSVLGLWGDLLVSYGAGYGDLEELAAGALEPSGEGASGPVASWLSGLLLDVVDGLGLEPADMRLRKPVLTNTQNVLDQAGLGGVASVRELVEGLPSSGSPEDLARALGAQLSSGASEGTLTVAELPIPGTGLSVPLTVELGGEEAP